jgi:hypothetical protein
MIEVPLSKRGWSSLIVTIVLLPIFGGYLSAFGAHLYEISITMVFDTQFQYVLLIIAALIAAGIVIGIALTVVDFNRQKKTRSDGAVRPTFSGIETDPDKIDPELRRKKEDDWKHFPANYK